MVGGNTSASVINILVYLNAISCAPSYGTKKLNQRKTPVVELLESSTFFSCLESTEHSALSHHFTIKIVLAVYLSFQTEMYNVLQYTKGGDGRQHLGFERGVIRLLALGRERVQLLVLNVKLGNKALVAALATAQVVELVKCRIVAFLVLFGDRILHEFHVKNTIAVDLGQHHLGRNLFGSTKLGETVDADGIDGNAKLIARTIRSFDDDFVQVRFEGLLTGLGKVGRWLKLVSKLVCLSRKQF